ncbi:MAG: hypothetical protein ACK53L_16380, partial [Pirellulaceae bacterium]
MDIEGKKDKSQTAITTIKAPEMRDDAGSRWPGGIQRIFHWWCIQTWANGDGNPQRNSPNGSIPNRWLPRFSAKPSVPDPNPRSQPGAA